MLSFSLFGLGSAEDRAAVVLFLPADRLSSDPRVAWDLVRA
jgi:hypothetical protein